MVAQVPTIADFDPAKKTRANRPPFTAITFKPGGRTDSPVRVWSENMLMDLNRFQALMMTPKTIAGADYLFIEVGGFGTRNKPGWKPHFLVLSR